MQRLWRSYHELLLSDILFSVLPFKINMFFVLFLHHILRFEFWKSSSRSLTSYATSELTHLHIAFSATSCPVRLFFAWKQREPFVWTVEGKAKKLGIQFLSIWKRQIVLHKVFTLYLLLEATPERWNCQAYRNLLPQTQWQWGFQLQVPKTCATEISSYHLGNIAISEPSLTKLPKAHERPWL